MKSREDFSANIANISPRHEMVGSDGDVNLHEKMIKEDVIFRDDIEKYAKHLATRLNSIKDEKDKKVFIIDDLSNSVLLKKVKRELLASELNSAEAEAIINRVRNVLLEYLKDKIEHKVYMVVKDLVAQIPGNRKNIIQEVVNVSDGQEAVHKDQGGFEEQRKSKNAAMDILMGDIRKRGDHPNIVKVLNYNFETGKAVYEKLNLQSLEDFLKTAEKDKEGLLTSLRVIKDCLAGVAYLSEIGLVLQDIKLDNLGLATGEGKSKGILFDIEGLVEKGAVFTIMLGAVGKKEYLPPEWEENTLDGIQESQMTYQFGVCLEKVLFLYEFEPVFRKLDYGIKHELGDLRDDMMEENPGNRISLAEAKEKLEEIMDRLTSDGLQDALKVAG